MSSLSRKFSRVLVASGAALALSSFTLLGASAAHADDSDRVLALNSGEIVVHVGDTFAGYTVAVWAPIPDGSGQYLLESDEVEPDGDGYSATVSNLAGPVAVELINASQGPSGDQNEEFEPNAAIFRGATVDVAYEDGEFVLLGDLPTSPVPDSTELKDLIPTATYTFTPTSFEKGKAFTVKFRDVKSTIDGKRVGEQEPTDVDFYGYSAPSFISGASIVNGELDFTVPVEYTNEPHTIAAFDAFGRLTLGLTLDGGVAAPAATPARPALANTGAGDQTGALALGAGVLALGAAAVAGGLVLRRRTAE